MATIFEVHIMTKAEIRDFVVTTDDGTIALYSASKSGNLRVERGFWGRHSTVTARMRDGVRWCRIQVCTSAGDFDLGTVLPGEVKYGSI